MSITPTTSRESAFSDPFAGLQAQNELLKAQLLNTSLINELSKVMQTCTDLENIYKTLLFGIQEILQFDRVILFEIDPARFCIRPRSWVGLENLNINEFLIPLGFEGGDVTDAIFLNRHLIVEMPDAANDIFVKKLSSPSYVVVPLISKATKKCWEFKQCNRTTCPVYGGYNPYCWSVPGSGQMLNAQSEDQRRRFCAECACFRCEGVFWMDRSANHLPITSDDVTTLTTVINQAGIIIENYRILEEIERTNNDLSNANKQLKQVNHDLSIAQAKINTDLKHAHSIQQGLLPQNLQDTKDFSIGARYIPAAAVGGDYYDVFEIHPGVYGIIVADVSGHGIASALIMSMAKMLLKIFATNEVSPQKTLERINRTFQTEIRTDNFVTIFYAVLDTRQKELFYTSAGHCPVLLIDKETKECSRINADGLFLGVFPDMRLSESRYPYAEHKKRLVLYTDGLTETHNDNDEMFDLNRLEIVSMNTLHASPNKAVDEILEYHRKFYGSSAPEDDITLLVIDF
jgi:serine phosphatase RsbU (regulator of sigma subunit)